MQSSPISYELDGRQYILTGSGSVLFAWALPEGKIDRRAPGKTAAGR
jgi:alcohol dehydrogenase (cytochrome c)